MLRDGAALLGWLVLFVDVGLVVAGIYAVVASLEERRVLRRAERRSWVAPVSTAAPTALATHGELVGLVD